MIHYFKINCFSWFNKNPMSYHILSILDISTSEWMRNWRVYFIDIAETEQNPFISFSVFYMFYKLLILISSWTLLCADTGENRWILPNKNYRKKHMELKYYGLKWEWTWNINMLDLFKIISLRYSVGAYINFLLYFFERCFLWFRAVFQNFILSKK